MHVKGKTILITGGAGGLGSVMAKTLADNGADTFILDLPATEGAAAALVAELKGKGVNACFEPIDLTSEEAWEKTVADVLAKAGRIDVLINKAGINIRKPVEEMSYAEWMTMMSVNN